MEPNKDPGERHRELCAEGWSRRFTVEEPRLSEMKAYYESLGMEVRVEAGNPEERQECSGCLTAPEFADRYGTIYTRGSASEASEEDDLF
jgi:hypothetical protein